MSSIQVAMISIAEMLHFTTMTHFWSTCWNKILVSILKLAPRASIVDMINININNTHTHTGNSRVNKTVTNWLVQTQATHDTFIYLLWTLKRLSLVLFNNWKWEFHKKYLLHPPNYLMFNNLHFYSLFYIICMCVCVCVCVTYNIY